MIRYLKIEGCGIQLKVASGVSSQVPHTLLYSHLVPIACLRSYLYFCVWFNVVVMGYYEWLKKGKDKVPHFTKRGDGKIMLLAGLWDSVQYEGTPTPRESQISLVSLHHLFGVFLGC
jgi:hypothetical protein